MQSIKLRQDFLNYFRKQKHRFLTPSKVYNNDPSLLFVNAGMNQLKPIILGKEETKSKSLMNYQICVRAGGKHNDLDDVGYDSYHLTSFEMLGNWSLDNYGKDIAIEQAYNFLTEVVGLDKERMYFTYYEGSDEIAADNETREIWEKYTDEIHIVKGSHKDNFWMMADDGPCGVSTEIHYDLIGGRNASDLVNKDDPTVVEIWNLVFIQYNKQNGIYQDLGKLYIDTGMGLERLSMILQNKKTLYQTDVFRRLVGYAQALTNGEYFTDVYDPKDKNYYSDAAYRIFADHMRTTINAIFDGVEFAATDRGHILKKIYRRALTHMYVHLNNRKAEPLMTSYVVKGLITDILNYFLKNKHDVETIHKILIDEEHLYLGKIYNSRKKYNVLKKNKLPIEKISKKLKEQFGIDSEIVDYIESMEFSME